MVFVQVLMRPIEQNKEPGNRPVHMWKLGMWQMALQISSKGFSKQSEPTGYKEERLN
jgi:hypothetical protein